MNNNKTILVTGSTSGIGLGIAKQFASNGYNVIVNGFADDDTVTNILAELTQLGAKFCEYVDADLMTNGGCAKLIKIAQDKAKVLGLNVDMLVNNAGMQYVAPIEEFSVEKWQQIINLNLSAAFYLSKCLVPSMKANGWGRIINIASTHGLVASGSKPAYVAAKHGIIGLTKALALELANTGITVNAVCPGWVLTPLVMQQIEAISKQDNISYQQAEQKLISEKQPMLKFNTPESIAAMVLFLVADHSQAITGSAMVMDGGWTAQ
ncbi:MAG: 3-hydroxybutyrate dehydrogenase [Pseudomonadota bacterium]